MRRHNIGLAGAELYNCCEGNESIESVEDKRHKIWGLLAAAGSGKRFGGSDPKQYISLLGEPVLFHSLRHLCDFPDIHGVAIGISKNDRRWAKLQFRHHRFLGSFTGGSERFLTVANGLEYLLAQGAANTDWVLVHDCARPCLTREDAKKVREALGENNIGIVLGVPVTDTLKRVNEQNEIVDTPPRELYWRAMTPQCFTIGELKYCLEQVTAQGLQTITDEASAVERFGKRPRMIRGREDNIKITWPEDLHRAEHILSQQEGGR